MSTPQHRVTQKDVAKAAGVHHTSVSLALKKHPSIPEKTRERIRRVAEKLGYTPDPMLSALAAYRNDRRARKYQGTIAWLANNRPDWDWKSIGPFRQYYEGARAGAAAHGFKLEIFDLLQTAPARIAAVMRARNIGGMLVAPQPEAGTRLDFEWNDFAAVTFGYTLVEPQVNTFTATQFRATVETMRELYRRGYRKIGFAISGFHDERVDHNALAGYLVETQQQGKTSPVPLLESADITPAEFRTWFDRHRPDAVLVGPWGQQLVRQAGLKAPNEIGLACPMLPNENDPLSGIYEDSYHIGEVATDFLVGQMKMGIRGLPRRAQRILLEGVWNEGTTLRSRAE